MLALKLGELPLNDANYDLKVNFLECIFEDAKGKTIRFTWITDINLSFGLSSSESEEDNPKLRLLS